MGVPVGEWGESHGSPCVMADDHRRKGSLRAVTQLRMQEPQQREKSLRGRESESLEQGVRAQSRGGGHLHG